MPTILVTNTERGLRGVNTLSGLVYVASGATSAPLEVSDDELAAMATYAPYFEITVDSAGIDPNAPAEPQLGDLKVAELKALAAAETVELPHNASKAVIVEAIEAARAAKAAADAPNLTDGVHDDLDALSDEALADTVAALTGAPAPAGATRDELLAAVRGAA